MDVTAARKIRITYGRRRKMKSKSKSESEIASTLQVGERHVRSKRVILGIIAAVVVAVAVLAVVGKITMGATKPTQFQTQEARKGDMTVIVTATGTLQATNSVDVGSELSGTVKTVQADYNDRVKAGQVLVRLDTLKLEAQLTQSKAALESARAKVLQAQATVKETRNKLAQFQKVRELSDNKIPSQSEFDAAEAALERARADEASTRAAVSQAEAALQANQTDLAKAVIVSPISGIVITRSIEPGQTVAAAFTAPILFTIAEDLTQMELQVNVDEADVGQVRQGQKATFSVDAYPNRTYEARITKVRYGSKTVDGVVTYLTVLKVDNSDLSLRPGMTATADIIVQKVEKAILVPAAALRFVPPVQEEQKSSGGLLGALLPHPPSPTKPKNEPNPIKKEQRVWALKDGRPTAIDVSIGATNGTMVQILSGEVTPGMALVTDIVTEKQ
jgi:HlyD family secretion protein